MDFITPQLNQLRSQFVAEGFDIRLVGGCVRDIMAGLAFKDVDLCTNADPTEQIKIYQKHGHRFIPTGFEHGTVTVVLDGEPYEVTSLRLDVATDGRRATVAYTRDWIADLERRDLTINAMSMTFDGELIDPFNGADHLANGIIKFVGDANQRIREDYLRIMRWFRFSGRFGKLSFDRNMGFDVESWRAIAHNAQGIRQVSVERIWNEVKAILRNDSAPNVLAAISISGVGAHIGLPSHVANNGASAVECISFAKEWTTHPELLMLAWSGWHEDITRELAKDWRWSSAEVDHMEWFAKHAYTNADLRRLIAIDNAPREWVRELAHAEGRSAWETNALVEWVFPPFPVNGHDIMSCGVKPGPAIGKMIAELKEIWADSGYTATKEQLLLAAIK